MMKTIRDYINLIENLQRQGVAEDDAGDVEQRFAVKMEKEKQRLAKLKQTDPEAYKREMEKRKTSSRIPPVSTFEGQGVAEGSLNEFAPGDSGDDRTYEYEVYQCNPNDEFDWIGGPIYKSNDMGKVHTIAYELWKKHPDKAFMVWQERSQGSRGGYGIKDDKEGVAEDDAGDVEKRMIAKIEKEKQRLAKLKQTDPEAYKREMEKRKTSSRIPPVSTFEEQGVAEEQVEESGPDAIAKINELTRR